MSFRCIARDIRDSFRSLSRHSFDVRLPGHHRGKSHGSFHDINNQTLVIYNSRWANLPPELLYDVIKRLEESERTWPARKHVVACAAVCRSWRSMCKEIVKGPEICGKLTFPVSLKQSGPRDGTIQCFIKRDKYNLTYHLFLCLSLGAVSLYLPALSTVMAPFSHIRSVMIGARMQKITTLQQQYTRICHRSLKSKANRGLETVVKSSDLL